jgi:hypothetical protein
LASRLIVNLIFEIDARRDVKRHRHGGHFQRSRDRTVRDHQFSLVGVDGSDDALALPCCFLCLFRLCDGTTRRMLRRAKGTAANSQGNGGACRDEPHR